MVKNILFGLIVIGIIFSLGSPMAVLAQEDVVAPNLTEVQIFEMIETIVNWVFTILLITSVFMILIAAFQFVTSGDNPDGITKARSRLIWAIVGIALALFAKSIPNIINSVLNP